LGQSFKDLVVWQRAVQMSLAIYKLTASFPPSEQFGLTNQLRRASVSVATNIAEGYGRSTRGEHVQFLGHARGSNCEVQTQLVIADGLGLGSEEARRSAEGLSEEISRMVVALMTKLRKWTPPFCSLFPTPCSLVLSLLRLRFGLIRGRRDVLAFIDNFGG
jgi:four helix bundle protein